MADAEASPHRGVMIVLAYLWPLALVPLLLDKQDPEVRWHAKHGLILMAAEILAAIAYAVLISIVSLRALGFGIVLGLLLVAGWIGILALHVIAILKGVNGERLRVPGLSDYASRV
jgi:uncharacterized membrane protein